MTRIAALLVISLLAACAPAQPAPAGEVAIYLPAQPMSGGEVLAANLDQLPLEQQPIIAGDDILSYSPRTYELEVSPAARTRLAALKVPVEGRGFVVCIDGKPIYAGAFWVPWSSLSFEGPTINLPLQPSARSLHIYRGYPGVEGTDPADPRNDPRLLEAFRLLGKLR